MRMVKEKYVKMVMGIINKHLAKYKNKKMSIEELDRLCKI